MQSKKYKMNHPIQILATQLKLKTKKTNTNQKKDKPVSMNQVKDW